MTVQHQQRLKVTRPIGTFSSYTKTVGQPLRTKPFVHSEFQMCGLSSSASLQCIRQHDGP
eukprot:8707-Heterococcus_DN1.PRE.2